MTLVGISNSLLVIVVVELSKVNLFFALFLKTVTRHHSNAVIIPIKTK